MSLWCNIGKISLCNVWWEMFYLLKLVGNHCKGLENCICWPGDGDYPLRAVPLWNVDTGTTLKGKKREQKANNDETQAHIMSGNNNRKVLRTSSRIFFTVSPFWKERKTTIMRFFVCFLQALWCFTSSACCVCDKYLSYDASNLLQQHKHTQKRQY